MLSPGNLSNFVRFILVFKRIMDFNVKVIAFDADDTLWSNEPFYREVERKYAMLLTEYGPQEYISEQLLEVENNNIALLGYGAKAFTISMIENAIKVSKGRLSPMVVGQIIELGKSLLTEPMKPLKGVVETLDYLKRSNKYKLVLATKGELLDQGRKLERSGLSSYFEHVEIMPNKAESNYERLLKILGVDSEDFLMVGNSLKSDMLPVLNIGGKAVYIPFEVIWQHEVIEDFEHFNMIQLTNIEELKNYL